LNHITVLLDVDDCCGEMIPAWIDLYNDIWKDSLKHSDVLTWEINEYVKPECGMQIFDLLRTPGFYDRVKPISGYQDGVAGLRARGCQIIYVTAAPRGTADMKIEWLYRHDPQFRWQDAILSYHKHMIEGAVLIDDSPHNLGLAKVKTVRFAQPYNVGVAAHAHTDGWDGMYERIQEALARKEKFIRDGEVVWVRK
jgi:5'-nucleotidase